MRSAPLVWLDRNFIIASGPHSSRGWSVSIQWSGLYMPLAAIIDCLVEDFVPQQSGEAWSGIPNRSLMTPPQNLYFSPTCRQKRPVRCPAWSTPVSPFSPRMDFHSCPHSWIEPCKWVDHPQCIITYLGRRWSGNPVDMYVCICAYASTHHKVHVRWLGTPWSCHCVHNKWLEDHALTRLCAADWTRTICIYIYICMCCFESRTPPGPPKYMFFLAVLNPNIRFI